MENITLTCGKCGVELVEKKLNLDYLRHRISHEFPCCPQCGEMYIPEEMVRGKMHEVEAMLEDK